MVRHVYREATAVYNSIIIIIASVYSDKWPIVD